LTLIRFASSTSDLKQILLLQSDNAKSTLSASAIENEGFVTVRHGLDQLQEMQRQSPQILAVDGDTLAGYALVMPRELKNSIPVLIPMFNLLDTLTYKGAPVKDLRYYVMGQICVAKAYRGKGVFRQLYAAHKKHLSGTYDYCITEISSRNLRSMRAHEKVGFTLLHRFSDATDEWNIVLWDWTDSV